MAITIAQLRTFLAVEKAGSIKGAAAELMVTQPSVSGAISALEREVGVKLFARRGRGIVSTPAGDALAPFGSRVVGLLEEGKAAAVEAADPERRELKIAAVNTAGEYIIPAILRAFRRLHPRIDVRLEVGNRARVFHQVELRLADVGVGGSPPESGELEGVPFLDNELVVIASPEDPLAFRRGVGFEELGRATWLLREPGSGTRIFTLNLLAEKGIKPSTMTIGSNGAIKQSVRAGLGISLQSRQAISLELEMALLKEVDLAEGIPERRWYALIPRDAARRPAIETFLRFLSSREASEAIVASLAMPVGEARRVKQDVPRQASKTSRTRIE